MKIFKEVFFWLAVLALLVLVFGYRIHDYSGAFLFTTFLLPVLIGSSYMFSEFLIPKYLLHKRYFRFILYTIYTLIISLNLTIIVMILSFSVIANYRFDNMLPASRDVLILGLVILLIALIKSSWKLVKNLFIQEITLNQFAEKEKLQTSGFLNVKANRQEHRIPLTELAYIESLADYIKYHLTKEKPIIARERISALSDRLPANFLRIHRSYIVNLDHMTNFTAETVNINDQELPIGRKFKTDVMKILKSSDF